MRSRFVLPFADVGSGVKPPDGAQLFFSEVGQSFAAAPKDTFTTESGPTANANPVIADSTGIFPDIWTEGRYKAVLQDKNNVQIWEADPIITSNSGEQFETVADMIANFGGDVGDMVTTKGYYVAGDIGAGRYLIEAAQSVDDFGDHTLDDTNTAILQKSGLVNAFQYGVLSTADSGPRLKAALDKHTVVLGGGGTFRIDSLVSFTEGQRLIGKGATINLSTSNDAAESILFSIDGINAAIIDCHFVPVGISGATGVVQTPIRITKDHFSIRGCFFEGFNINERFSNNISVKGVSAGDNYTVEGTVVDGNTFTWSAFCFHEFIGYTANDTAFTKNIAYNTTGNVVLFNGEKLNPAGGVRLGTKGVLISDNYAKDIGYADDPTGASLTAKERRFFASTLVDNLIISNNIIDHVFGDAPIHIERPGSVSITGNSFNNCHGSLAQGISIEAGSVSLDGVNGPLWDDPELNVSITDNIFTHSDVPNAAGNDSGDIISTAGAVTLENINITGNTFEWWTTYPQTPTIVAVAADSLRAILINQSTGTRVIESNRLLNMRVGVQISNNSQFGGNVDKNYFRNCEQGILQSGLASPLDSIVGNTFKECNDSWIFDTAFPPLVVGENRFIDCTSAVLGLISPKYSENIYDTVTTIDDPISEQVTVTNTGAGTWDEAILGQFAGRMSGTISVRIAREGGDTRVSTFGYGFRETGEFDAQELYTFEIRRVGILNSIPTIALSEFAGRLIITLSGGTTDNDYFAVVNIDGIAEVN